MSHRRHAYPITAIVLIGGVLAGCASAASPGPGRAEAPPPAAAEPSPAIIAAEPSVGIAATATSTSVTVHEQPGGAVTTTLDNPQASGAPLTFLVAETGAAWLKVYLPQRPNGSTGWVSAAEVTLTRLQYRIVVSTKQNTLSLYRGSTLLATYSVATGTGGTPTPLGDFYLTELIAPTNTGYGPYAFGLSAYSEVLTSFGAGPGQIGLHGTNDAASIGTAASHGCIRMSNEDITTLAGLLPLGTPITIE